MTAYLRCTGNHILNVIGMPGAVDVGIVSEVRLVLDVGGVDGDAPRALLRRLVNVLVGHAPGLSSLGEDLGDRGGKGGLAVIDVANCSDVDVRLIADVCAQGTLHLALAQEAGAGRLATQNTGQHAATIVRRNVKFRAC